MPASGMACTHHAPGPQITDAFLAHLAVPGPVEVVALWCVCTHGQPQIGHCTCTHVRGRQHGHPNRTSRHHQARVVMRDADLGHVPRMPTGLVVAGDKA